MVVLGQPAVITLAAVLGLAVGSFLNVVILRTRQEMSPLRGRSRCPHCHAELRWFELIPLMSFVIQGGRCRRCHKYISWQYPLVEGLTAVLFGIVAWQVGWHWLLAVDLVLVAALIAVAVYDWRWALLPDGFTITLGVVGAVVAWMAHLPVLDIAIGGAAGAGFFALQYYGSRKRWVGSGDVLLGAALGLLLGWRMLGLALLLAYFIGAIVAAILLLSKIKSTTSSMAFGPYLAFGAFVAWLWGANLVDWYFQHAIFR